MINNKTLQTLEYDKILKILSDFAVLDLTKSIISEYKPKSDYLSCKILLDKTKEADLLLYKYGICKVEYFEMLGDEFDRAKKGATLSMGELLKIAKLLRSSRIASTSIINLNAEEIVELKKCAERIFYDYHLENSIFTKIINENTMADNASEKLFEIRKAIRLANEKIREKLQNYMRAGANKYLQDNVVSMRSGRYVVPVKSEHVHSVKGFIHDRSITGNTFFIEPQEILDLNNELKTLTLNEQVEIERILSMLTEQVSLISNSLEENLIYLSDIDLSFSKAEYAYKTKSIYPKINKNFYTKIVKGRHPLINKDKVVPISIELGKEYNYILISGPNTGGKTVTLKLVGLFTLMASSGFFVPAVEGTEISIFNDVFVDIGDEQSIEQNLSTFSSHVKNIIEITKNVSNSSLVLIDELGAGTDPEEGSALAKAIVVDLINKGSFGIITTHYSSLKEFALTSNKIINASMDFDSSTFAPLYRVRIGSPGLSNAIEIAKRLGLDNSLIESAKNNLSTEKKNFENVLLKAERVREEAEKSKLEIEELKQKQVLLYNELEKERAKFIKDKEKFLSKAHIEARKLVNEKLEDAENLLQEMKDIFDKEEYSKSDLVNMATLRNKLENEKYSLDEEEKVISIYEDIDVKKLKIGDKVFVKSLNNMGEVLEVNFKKQCVWVQVGPVRINAKFSDLSFISNKAPTKTIVTLKKNAEISAIKTEINVIGLDSNEALKEVEQFLDSAVTNNLEVVRIVHGKGLKILANAIHSYLRGQKFVESYRFGKYGEGEHGVTIVKLK